MIINLKPQFLNNLIGKKNQGILMRIILQKIRYLKNGKKDLVGNCTDVMFSYYLKFVMKRLVTKQDKCRTPNDKRNRTIV